MDLPKNYDGIRYSVLFAHKWYDEIYDTIKYLTSEKSGITDSINHSFAIITIDSYNSISRLMLIESVVNENKNNYYYNIFSEKDSNKDKSNAQYY